MDIVKDIVSIEENEKGKIITAALYTPSSNWSSGSYGFSNLSGSTTQFSSDNVKRYLSNHVDNAKNLRAMSDYIYNTNGTYRRLIDTIVNLLSFEYVITPIGLKSDKFDAKSYTNKYNALNVYLNNCNLNITLQDILFKLVKYGRYSGYDRDTYIQPLPLDYTRIVGMNADGNPLLQFNYDYFDEFSDERTRNFQLQGFDTFFLKSYKRYKAGIDNPKENFANELNWRMLPPEKTYTVKIGSNLESKEGIGLLYGLIDEILYLDEIRDLDRNIISAQRKKIIVQMLPVDKECNSVLGKEEIEQAHNNLKATVPPNVGVLTVLGGTKFEEIPLQLTALEKGKMEEVQNDIQLNAGVGVEALQGGNFSSGVLNIDVLTNTITSMLTQIQDIWFNRKFKTLVKGNQLSFKFQFLGVTSFNRSKLIESFDALLNLGGAISPSIALRGYDLIAYSNQMVVENQLKIKDNFVPLKSSFNVSKDDGNSKPEKDITETENDNTAKSKGNGANKAPEATT